MKGLTYGYLIGLLLLANPSLSLAQLNPAAGQGCPVCATGEVCVKTAAGPLACRKTSNKCSPACPEGKVCIEGSNPNIGLCVDRAPTTPPGGGGGTPPSGTPLQDGLTAFGGANSGLRTTGTLIGYVAVIIRWILGLLGMVFFVIIVLQGFLYMTASGDSSKTAAATGAITNAVVGLIIIMGAFLITNYVTGALIG